MPAREVIQMFLALSRFVENVYGNNVHMYNAILEGCHDALHVRGTVDDRKGQSLLVDMLLKPLDVRPCLTLLFFGTWFFVF